VVISVSDTDLKSPVDGTRTSTLTSAFARMYRVKHRCRIPPFVFQHVASLSYPPKVYVKRPPLHDYDHTVPVECLGFERVPLCSHSLEGSLHDKPLDDEGPVGKNNLMSTNTCIVSLL